MYLNKILIGMIVIILFSGCTSNTPGSSPTATETPSQNLPGSTTTPPGTPAISAISASDCSNQYKVESACAALAGTTPYYLPVGEPVLFGSATAKYSGIGTGACQWTKTNSDGNLPPGSPFQSAIVSVVLFDSDAKAIQELQATGTQFNAAVTNDSIVKSSEQTPQYPFGSRMFVKRVGSKIVSILQITGGGASVYCSPTEEEALATKIG